MPPTLAPTAVLRVRAKVRPWRRRRALLPRLLSASFLPLPSSPVRLMCRIRLLTFRRHKRTKSNPLPGILFFFLFVSYSFPSLLSLFLLFSLSLSPFYFPSTFFTFIFIFPHYFLNISLFTLPHSSLTSFSSSLFSSFSFLPHLLQLPILSYPFFPSPSFSSIPLLYPSLTPLPSTPFSPLLTLSH